MSFPTTGYLLFSFSLIIAILMLAEGCLVLLLKKQITPLPTRILYGLSVLVAGSERSKQQFSGRTSPGNLRTYAAVALIFGTMILLSSFVFLFTTIL